MQFPTDVSTEAVTRLRRIEGQVRGLQRLIDEGAECREIVTQLSAARSALDRVGFRLMASALSCPDGQEHRDELERLFLKLS
ncbi:MAG: metal-sensitive transcriptional regulator [Ilumatobacteraceae bacterium]